jgi:hypothetical protein
MRADKRASVAIRKVYAAAVGLNLEGDHVETVGHAVRVCTCKIRTEVVRHGARCLVHYIHTYRCLVHSHTPTLISLSLSLHLSLPLSPYLTSLIFVSLSHGLSLPPSLTLVLAHSLSFSLSLSSHTHTPKTLLPKTQAWSIEGHVIGCTSSGTVGTIVSQPPILFISLTIDSTDRHLKDAPSAVLSAMTCFGLVLYALGQSA